MCISTDNNVHEEAGRTNYLNTNVYTEYFKKFATIF